MSCIATESLTDAYRHCRDQLLESGLLISLDVDGLYGFSGVFEEVIERFERHVTLRGSHLQSEVMRLPPIMARSNYLKLTHIDNFPDLLGSVHTFTGNERDHLRMLDKRKKKEDWTAELTPTKVMLAPAACYPLYPTAAGTTLPADGRTIDLRAFVFRHEPSIDPARMQIFRQREFVRMGTAEQALEHREYWLKLGTEILSEVGLESESVIANDPFFGRGGKVMAAAQKEQVLKFELVHAVATAEKPTAITSCNYHQNHFGHTFDIRTQNGEEAHTSCIGFGLERIALALFMTHGFEPDHWPRDIKGVLGL